MIVNQEQIIKIKKTIDFIIETYEEFADDAEMIEIDDEAIEELADTDFTMPSFFFPGERDSVEISTEEFLEIADEIPSIQLLENSVIKTNLLRYYIVESADIKQQYAIRNHHNLKIKVNQDIEMDLVYENFIVGLAAISTGEYDSDFYGTISPYMAIEIKYKSKEATLKADEELELVKSYIFEVADSAGVSLPFSEIKMPEYYEEYSEEETEENGVDELRSLEPYNEGMRLFVSAMQIQEDD